VNFQAAGVSEMLAERAACTNAEADLERHAQRPLHAEADAERRGRETMLKQLLPVFDNLERAMQYADTASSKALGEGLRITMTQLVDMLGRCGFRRIAAVGQRFDPAVHEAIQQTESAEVPAGFVVREVQAGYACGDRLVRAPLVVVSSGKGSRSLAS
jgi:molecular chaperone GrpE